jgi:hypothetical protein
MAYNRRCCRRNGTNVWLSDIGFQEDDFDDYRLAGKLRRAIPGTAKQKGQKLVWGGLNRPVFLRPWSMLENKNLGLSSGELILASVLTDCLVSLVAFLRISYLMPRPSWSVSTT